MNPESPPFATGQGRILILVPTMVNPVSLLIAMGQGSILILAPTGVNLESPQLQ